MNIKKVLLKKSSGICDKNFSETVYAEEIHGNTTLGTLINAGRDGINKVTESTFIKNDTLLRNIKIQQPEEIINISPESVDILNIVTRTLLHNQTGGFIIPHTTVQELNITNELSQWLKINNPLDESQVIVNRFKEFFNEYQSTNEIKNMLQSSVQIKEDEYKIIKHVFKNLKNSNFDHKNHIQLWDQASKFFGERASLYAQKTNLDIFDTLFKLFDISELLTTESMIILMMGLGIALKKMLTIACLLGKRTNVLIFIKNAKIFYVESKTQIIKSITTTSIKSWYRQRNYLIKLTGGITLGIGSIWYGYLTILTKQQLLIDNKYNNFTQLIRNGGNILSYELGRVLADWSKHLSLGASEVLGSDKKIITKQILKLIKK